jgi:methylated-DNA-[protein]-cysteine S-methyltransferase
MIVTMLLQRFVRSPLGRLRLVATEAALVGVYFPCHRRAPTVDARDGGGAGVLALAERELAAYFAGERVRFSTPLAPRGTEFQLTVWAALLAIPLGETRSYAALARAIGRPEAARAVGAANGMNPLSVFVPCHRVVGAGGALTGYAGGVESKRWLLEHESRLSMSASGATPPPRPALP